MYRFCSLIFRDPQKGRVIASSILIFSRHKKATCIRSDTRGLDDHDSQVIPEEKTGTYWLDISWRVHPDGIPDAVFVGKIVAFGLQ